MGFDIISDDINLRNHLESALFLLANIWLHFLLLISILVISLFMFPEKICLFD